MFGMDRSVFGSFVGRLTGFRRNETGAAAIEFAFVAPIMILALFGSWEYSRAFSSEQKVSKVTGGVADLIARQPAPDTNLPSDAQISCSDIDGILQITDVLMWPFDPASMSVSIFNVRTKTANNTDVEIKWSAHNGRGTKAADVTATQYVVSNKLLVNVVGDEVIVVITKYNHPFAITGLANTLATQAQPGASTLTLGETTPMRPRIGPIRLVTATGKNAVNVAKGNTVTSNAVKCTAVGQNTAQPY